MDYSAETPATISSPSGEFFDFVYKNRHPIITTYQFIDRELIIKPEGNIFGGKKMKKKICSIPHIKQVFDKLITYVQYILNQYNVYDIDPVLESALLDHYNIELLPVYADIQPENRKLLIEQLTFDILRDKYFVESPRTTLHQYSLNLVHNVEDIMGNNQDIAESIRKCVSASISRQANNMSSPKLKAEIEKLGFNTDKYLDYFSKLGSPFTNGKDPDIVTKPKIAWDYHFYNGTQKLITGKQYNRSFNKHNNYSHGTLVNLFNVYDRFVGTAFMQEPRDSRDYFMKSMEFYYLEIYKRVDFIYKLAVRLEDDNSITIDKNHALVRRFTPETLAVTVSENPDTNTEISFTKMHRYYYPMLMLEEIWQQKKSYTDPQYVYTLQTHHLIRAKVYELFKYHYKFISDDYDELSDFIRNHYNILRYHEPNKVWIQPNKKRKRERDARIKKALEINDALFGDS